MTYAMTCEIVFPANDRREEIKIYKVTAIEFERTFKEITARGTLTLPRNYTFFGKTDIKYNAQKAFKRGDQVIISFGYDGNNVKEFEGYVTGVSSDIPIIINFEDEMFNIKRMPVNFSATKTSLKSMLKTIIPGYEIDALEGTELGGIRFSQTSVGAVLDKLKQSPYNLFTYYKNGKVVCGKYYTSNQSTYFHLERDCVSNDLNYLRGEELLIKIKCTSTMPNGSKIVVDDIGDKNGVAHNIPYYNIPDKSKLRQMGLIAYRKMKKSRFDGKFTAFGIPSITDGMRCELESSLYEDRAGTYYIDKVFKTFDRGGIRQEITIGENV